MASSPNYWLMKSEPDVYGIDHLKKEKKSYWDGVRNFKARNNMRDMNIGDGVLFYHSNAEPKGIVGIARVCTEAYPDFTQFDKKNKYYDRRATKDKPYWFMVDIEFVEKFDACLELSFLRTVDKLEGMDLLKKGQRLSVQQVRPEHWKAVLKLANSRAKA